MTYQSQAARDAQASGYGTELYWSYLDESAARMADYWTRRGDDARAAEMFTRSLSAALAGNESA